MLTSAPLSSSPLKMFSKSVRFSPCTSLGKKEETGTDFKFPGLGGRTEDGISPVWESAGEAWSEDKSESSSGSREGNACNGALHVVGLHRPSDKISLFLKDWSWQRWH